MTDTPWTPGPWEARGRDDFPYGLPVGPATGHSVARVHETPNGADNARLIAAAPEMADFLVELFHQFGSDPAEYRGRDYAGHLHGDDIAKGLELLARICGET